MSDDLDRIFSGPFTPSGTHRPVLAAVLRHTLGPILELGMGACSTPALHEVAHIRGRPLFSFENDAAYFARERFSELRSDWHHIALVPSWDVAPLELLPWSVALVDQSPGAARGRALERLRYQAEVVVAHDSEDACYGYAATRDLYRYWYEYRALRPWTLVLSNYHDVARVWAAT